MILEILLFLAIGVVASATACYLLVSFSSVAVMALKRWRIRCDALSVLRIESVAWPVPWDEGGHSGPDIPQLRMYKCVFNNNTGEGFKF